MRDNHPFIDIDCYRMSDDRQKCKRPGRHDSLLRFWGIDRVPEYGQYLCGYRASAEYRSDAAVCQLWTYIFSCAIYGDRDSTECWASAQKILTGG